MVVRCTPNSGHGGPPGTPFMTIFVFYVSIPIPNIQQVEVYEVYKSREVSHLFSYQISRRMPPGSCLETHFLPVMNICINVTIFDKCDNLPSPMPPPPISPSPHPFHPHHTTTLPASSAHPHSPRLRTTCGTTHESVAVLAQGVLQLLKALVARLSVVDSWPNNGVYRCRRGRRRKEGHHSGE